MIGEQTESCIEYCNTIGHGFHPPPRSAERPRLHSSLMAHDYDQIMVSVTELDALLIGLMGDRQACGDWPENSAAYCSSVGVGHGIHVCLLLP